MDSVNNLEKLADEARSKISKSKTSKEIEELEIQYLGRKSELNQVLRSISKIESDKRAEFGKKLNDIKKEVTELINNKKHEISKKEISHMVENEWLDVTMPGKGNKIGHIHPLTQMRWYAEDIFERMGFEIVEPREIDDDYHVFTSLNIPEGHPARDMWDTFWTEDGLIPITHTSSMQNRIMSSQEPPIRTIVPGKCFRNEATDARHEHAFYQIEGICIDRGITIQDMIGTFKAFMDEFYGREIEYRIQPTYFPFVEPALEFMIECPGCDNRKKLVKGKCPTCGGSGWIEVIPCGPIHPNVLKEAGVDPNVYSGFAWGLGLDRLIMIKYGIKDIRYFHSGDLRFLKQF